MKIIVNKEGIITIDPQDHDVIGIVELLKNKYYDVDIDIQYIETKQVYYMNNGSFYCSSKEIAYYNKDNKLDFVKNILKHFKVDFIEFTDEYDDLEFDENKIYLNTYECEDSIELVIKGEQKWYFDSWSMDEGVYGDISRLSNDIGCSFEWEWSRFTKGDVCESCYSNNLYKFEQDGDIRGECEVCGETTTLHYR